MIPSDQEYGDMIVAESPDADDNDKYDKYVGAQLLLNISGNILQGRVLKRCKGIEGNPIGQSHSNPLFDS